MLLQNSAFVFLAFLLTITQALKNDEEKPGDSGLDDDIVREDRGHVSVPDVVEI